MCSVMWLAWPARLSWQCYNLLRVSNNYAKAGLFRVQTTLT